MSKLKVSLRSRYSAILNIEILYSIPFDSIVLRRFAALFIMSVTLIFVAVPSHPMSDAVHSATVQKDFTLDSLSKRRGHLDKTSSMSCERISIS